MKRRLPLLLLVLVGCSFESPATTETVENRCGGDADCLVGVCNGNICIDDSNASVEVAVEVVGGVSKAQGAVPASWAFRAEPFTGSSIRDLVLPPTREVRGTVRWDGLRVPAMIRFVRRMANAVEPLQPVPVETDTLRDPVEGSRAGWLRLQHGPRRGGDLRRRRASDERYGDNARGCLRARDSKLATALLGDLGGGRRSD